MGYINGKTIKELRERQKLTQKELAERINVSDKTISKWGVIGQKVLMANPIQHVFCLSYGNHSKQ